MEGEIGMKLRQGTPEEVGMCPRRIALIKERAQQWASGDPHPALVVMAARRGVLVLQAAHGQLSPEADSPPLQLDSIFPLGSLTKSITATAMMILVDDALVGLNRPVQEYIPEFTGPGKELVFVHHLLTHTSGLNDVDIDRHILLKTKTVDLAQLVEESAIRDTYVRLGYDAPLTCPPGQRHYYCQYGIELLVEIIQRVSGQPLADFAQERIFGPLGMTDSSYIVPESVVERIVKRPNDAPWSQPEPQGIVTAPILLQSILGLDTARFRQTPWGCGGVFSTGPDMLRFGQMFLNRGVYNGQHILSPASVATMTRDQSRGIGQWVGHEQTAVEASYGYCWHVAGDTHFLKNGSLYSPETFAHMGAGGISLWVDPVYELVYGYFSVALRYDALNSHVWNTDLFANAITAAVID